MATLGRFLRYMSLAVVAVVVPAVATPTKKRTGMRYFCNL
jgi:hypothetical protein